MEDKIKDVLDAYCEGGCKSCKFEGICEWYDRWGVGNEIDEDFYLKMLEIEMRPYSKEEKAVLCAYVDIHEGIAASSKNTRRNLQMRAEGIELAYYAMTHYVIEYKEGKVVEKYTGIQLYPFREE